MANLNESQLLAAAMLATGTKAVVVAEELKVTEETISRWRKLPAFRVAINQLHAEAMEAISGKLRNMGAIALETFEELLTDPDTPARERLLAASKILELVGRSALLRKVGPLTVGEIATSDREAEKFAEMSRLIWD